MKVRSARLYLLILRARSLLRVQSALYVVAIPAAIVLLIGFVGFGAIVALIYRGRGSSFSYFDGETREWKEKTDGRSRAREFA